MAVAAFWIALAAVLIAGSWRKRSVELMRHEMVRLLIQQGRDIDEQQLKELINPPAPPPPAPLPDGHPWLRKPDPAQNYRHLRIAGCIFMIAAIGVVALITGVGIANGFRRAPEAALGVGAFVFLLGFAFFFVSRFVKPTSGES